MKFVPETYAGVNVISRHERERVWVGGQAHEGNLIVPWSGDVRAWAASRFALLSTADFEVLGSFDPELVIFGSGARLRFAPPALLQPLIARRIGVECMDTAAACRTYNVLAGEGRRVLAALLVEPG